MSLHGYKPIFRLVSFQHLAFIKQLRDWLLVKTIVQLELFSYEDYLLSMIIFFLSMKTISYLKEEYLLHRELIILADLESPQSHPNGPQVTSVPF